MFRLTPDMLPYLGIALLIDIVGIQILFSILMKSLGVKGDYNKPIASWFIISVVFLAPFFEELLCRGPIYLFFHDKFSFWAWLVIISGGLIFGFFHLRNIDEDYDNLNELGYLNVFLSTAMAGILLGWLTVKTNSLLPPILCHAMVNLCIVIHFKLKTKIR